MQTPALPAYCELDHHVRFSQGDVLWHRHTALDDKLNPLQFNVQQQRVRGGVGKTNSFDYKSGSLAVLRRCERNAPGQQFIDPIDWAVRDALQHVCQIGLRVQVAELAKPTRL